MLCLSALAPPVSAAPAVDVGQGPGGNPGEGGANGVGNGLNDAPGIGNGNGNGNGNGGNGPNPAGNGVNLAEDGVDDGEAAAPANSVKAPRALSEAETDAELARGELAELDPILEEARQANGGRVVGVTLVQADGVLLFEVRMVGGEQVENLYFDARSGRPVGGR